MQGQHEREDDGKGGDRIVDNGHVRTVDNSGGNAQRGLAVVPLRTGGKVSGIVPTSIEEVFRLATAIAKSGMAPRDMATPEKLTVAILHGLEIGIPPMMAINKIAIVNGRPTLWGDAVPALLLSKGFKLREMMYAEGEDRFAQCTVIRPNGEQIVRNFSVRDAMTAGLWGKQGPWKQYPDRMLQMRARGLASRDGAADVLSGIYLAEEMQDVEPPTDANELEDRPPHSSTRKTSYRAKQDGDQIAYGELSGAVSRCGTIEALDDLLEKNAEFLDSLPYAWARVLNAEITDKRAELTEASANG